MIYVLEFYHHPPEGDGDRVYLATEKRRIKSADLALSYVRSAMDNVLFEGKRAHLCSIKDQTGTVICEVKRDADRA